MNKVKLQIRNKKKILGLFFTFFIIGIFPNVTLNLSSLNHEKIFVQNKVFAEDIRSDKLNSVSSSNITQQIVTINFLNVDNPAIKVQKSQTMIFNVGEYVCPSFGTLPSQFTQSVYHFYQIPNITNYSYQNNGPIAPLLVTENAATNVINLYYKRDTSQVTIKFVDSEGNSIYPSEMITANVGDYVWIVSLGNITQQMKFGVYWYFAPEITGYSFEHGTPIKVSKNPEENIVNLYYNVSEVNSAEYSFDYEYEKDTPDQSLALPSSFTAKKGDSISTKIPYGYSISEVLDDKGNSYSSPMEALEEQKDNEPRTFRIIVSANKSSLILTVNKPNGKSEIQNFFGFYGGMYKVPIEETLTSNGKIYHAMIKITKRDWRFGTSVSFFENSEEIASLVKDNFLVGKYDSSTISVEVSYTEEALVPVPPSKAEDKKVSSTTSLEPTKEKEQEKAVEKKKATSQAPAEKEVTAENEIKIPLAPPAPSFSSTEKVIASPSITNQVNQEAHILKMRIAGAAGLATGAVSAYGILRALKMMVQHFGKLGKFIK